MKMGTKISAFTWFGLSLEGFQNDARSMTPSANQAVARKALTNHRATSKAYQTKPLSDLHKK